jgi:uncharacterized membrane protein
LNRTIRIIAGGTMGLLALAIGLVSLRYALPDGPHRGPAILANAFANPALAIHATGAAIALMIGPFQFIRARSGRRPPWHRVSGPAYLAACLIAAPAGFVLALGTTAGPVAATGFGVLAVVWLYVNLRGLQAVLAGRYVEHGRWMARSYALTFAAVNLRLYLVLGGALGLDVAQVYVATAWISWIPNLAVMEAWLRRSPQITTNAPA